MKIKVITTYRIQIDISNMCWYRTTWNLQDTCIRLQTCITETTCFNAYNTHMYCFSS